MYLHSVSKVMKRIFVDQWNKTDHQRNRAIATDNIWVASVLQQHVEQLVAKLPVSDMP